MPFEKGHIPWNTNKFGLINSGSFKNNSIPWNKGLPCLIKRCPACGSFINKKGEHICRGVETKDFRYCLKCKILLKNKGWERYSKICGRCGKIIQRQKQRELRAKLITDFGGKCEKCGYNNCLPCLEFHHKNKEEKKNKNFLKEILKNPKKFNLLCNRCHREIHNGV